MSSKHRRRLPHLVRAEGRAVPKRLGCEFLEDRRMLATFLVTNTADAGSGSLRDAVELANFAPGADDIQFSPALSGQAITLTGGQIEITDEVDIVGLGSTLLTVDANNNSRLFDITNSDTAVDFDVSLSGLTLTGGRSTTGDSSGGAIRSTENLTIVDAVVTGNSTDAYGGGIHVFDGTLTITDSEVTSNSASSSNGGGGLNLFDATATIQRTSVANNYAADAGAFRAGDTQLHVIDSVISDNSSGSEVGMRSFSYASASSVTIERSTLTNNADIVVSKQAARPTLDITGSTITDSLLILRSANITVSDSTLTRSGISSTFAPGDQTGLTTVNRTTIDGEGSSGIGIYSLGDVALYDSAITGHGTGLYTVYGTVSNSTISGNSNSGIYTPGQVDVSHSTIASNGTVGFPGGGFVAFGFSNSLDHTIIADNLGDYGDTYGSFDATFSLLESVGAATITGANNQLGVDPMLAPLANNGGLTLTQAPMPGSPVLNAGDPAFTSPPSADQRGVLFSRVSGTIDIGAVESQSIDLVVDTDIDESDDSFVVGDLSLREAIEQTNANPGADGITFNGALAGATILLNDGQLHVTDSLELEGLGADQLTIDAQGNSRVLYVHEPQTFVPTIDVSIADLTITGGYTPANGAGIGSRENLVIARSMITGNQTSGLFDAGGGIWNYYSDLLIYESTISGNTAGGSGGGIYHYGYGTQVVVTDSTISGNSSAINGGGFFFYYSLLDMTNTTISGNTAAGDGGGLLALQGQQVIRHSTITDNHALGTGSGIASKSTSNNSTELGHTIVSGNVGNDVAFVSGATNPFVTLGYNVIGVGNGGPSFNGTGDQRSITDPRLGVLGDNGGSTRTHALMLDSPAFDAGDPNAMAGVGDVPEFDQRGTGFPRVLGGRIDVGAFERSAPPTTMIVDTLVDESDGDHSAGDLSLREAIELANAASDTNDILFDTSLAGGTIALTMGVLIISQPANVIGPGADQLTIDAGGNSGVFRVDDFDTNTLIEASIQGLTITGGEVSAPLGAANGGGIASSEVLTVSRATIENNSADGFAGGIVSTELTLVDSTVANNTADMGGGGIWVAGHPFTGQASSSITNSTISGNVGGGIVNSFFSDLLIQYSTITANLGDGVATDVLLLNNSTTVKSTIIAGNTGDDVELTSGSMNVFQSGGYNVIGDGDAVSAFTAPGDQTGVSDPRLQALAGNGGPTQTHALMSDSPALDAGDPAAVAGVGDVPEFDQRGSGFSRVIGTRIDVGAFERQSTQPDPDFDNDGTLDGVDIDLLQDNLVNGPADPSTYDLTGDGSVDVADRDLWLALAGAANLPSGNPYLLGDANLDGTVDGVDFLAWNGGKFTLNTAWSAGDFDANGVVDGQDFIIWNGNKFQMADVAGASAFGAYDHIFAHLGDDEDDDVGQSRQPVFL